MSKLKSNEEIQQDRDIPMRSDRAKCWASRDAFFACLSDHGIGIFDQKAVSKTPCFELYKEMDGNCLPSWTTHFILRRQRELEKEAFTKMADQRVRTGQSPAVPTPNYDRPIKNVTVTRSSS
ncbi:uncharacterized protein V1516DRAFT_680189 [Lipomyces oligophaga]|uniref:uncharacterized protein n=1 Tax=Lipomyces oligophaga TaxID=45792 RepID=UPI0034CD38E0